MKKELAERWKRGAEGAEIRRRRENRGRRLQGLGERRELPQTENEFGDFCGR